jgi:uncharacterized protein with PQ loop repeat
MTELFSNLSLELIIGPLTIAWAFVVKFVGFPSQIKRIHQNKSIKDISTTYFVIGFIAYVLWTIHGIVKQDMVVIIGQGLGIITTGIILGQIIYYKRKDYKRAN